MENHLSVTASPNQVGAVLICSGNRRLGDLLLSDRKTISTIQHLSFAGLARNTVHLPAQALCAA
jgi:hypothetical protein